MGHPVKLLLLLKTFLTHTDSLLSPLLSRNKAFHDNVQSCNFFLENHVQRCDTTTVAGILVTQKKWQKLATLSLKPFYFLPFDITSSQKIPEIQNSDILLAKVTFILKVNVNLTHQNVKQFASKWYVQIFDVNLFR